MQIPPSPEALAYFKAHPGEGLDWWDNAHNEYIHLFYELGYPFLILGGFLFYHIYMTFKRSRRSKETVALLSCLIVFAIFSITQFPLHISRIGHLLPVLGAMFVISTKE